VDAEAGGGGYHCFISITRVAEVSFKLNCVLSACVLLVYSACMLGCLEFNIKAILYLLTLVMAI